MIYILSFIAMFESFTHDPYHDRAQNTVGYGSKATEKMCITEDYALAMLQRDVMYHYSRVSKLKNLNACQVAALTSFSYNVGYGAFRASRVYKEAKAGRLHGAADALDSWVFKSGKKMTGLVARRKVEKRVFLASNLNGCR